MFFASVSIATDLKGIKTLERYGEQKERNKTLGRGEKKESGGCYGDQRGEIPEWSRPLRSVLGSWTVQHLGLLQCGLKKKRYLI